MSESNVYNQAMIMFEELVKASQQHLMSSCYAGKDILPEPENTQVALKKCFDAYIKTLEEVAESARISVSEEITSVSENPHLAVV